MVSTLGMHDRNSLFSVYFMRSAIFQYRILSWLQNLVAWLSIKLRVSVLCICKGAVTATKFVSIFCMRYGPILKWCRNFSHCLSFNLVPFDSKFNGHVMIQSWYIAHNIMYNQNNNFLSTMKNDDITDQPQPRL